MPSNILLPSNTEFYITDVTVPVSWYTTEANKNDTIYFIINGTDYAPSTCTIPERKNTITRGAALCKAMHDNYRFPCPTGGTTPTRFVSNANLANNTFIISNANDTFDILTDTQVVALLHMGLYTSKVPTCSLNDMFAKYSCADYQS